MTDTAKFIVGSLAVDVIEVTFVPSNHTDAGAADAPFRRQWRYTFVRLVEKLTLASRGVLALTATFAVTVPAEVSTAMLIGWVTGTDRSRTTTRAKPPAGIGLGSARYQIGSPASKTSWGGGSCQ